MIQARLQTGAFANPEDVIFDALRSSEPAMKPGAARASGRNLVEVCAVVQGLADDLDITRNKADSSFYAC